LIKALREEVQEYGELLKLLDEQQAAILDRNPAAIRSVQRSIKPQLNAVFTGYGMRGRVMQTLHGLGCAVVVARQPLAISASGPGWEKMGAR